MNLDLEVIYLVGGVISLLALSSIITRILIFRHHGEPSNTLENLSSRVKAWWYMVLVFGISLALGKNGVFAMYTLLSFLALREYITLSHFPRGDHRTLTWIFFIILPLHYFFAWAPWHGMFSIFIPIYGFIFIPIRSALAGEVENFLQRTSRIQWGVLTCVYFLSHLPMLLYLEIPGYENQNAKLLFFVVLITQISDVCQYVFGKTIGRRKIAPNISPGKTWEGLIGGGLSAVALGTSLWWATPFTPLCAAMMSFILVLAGFLGGLVMSAIKRSIGAKDWGRGIPGHGGVLDRMDSLLFAAPLFFHITRYLYTSPLHNHTPPSWLLDWVKG
jgi:phosphatidate cytidylyltransferase